MMAVLALIFAAPAQAQVTTSDSALAGLAPTAPAAPAPAPSMPAGKVTHHAAGPKNGNSKPHPAVPAPKPPVMPVVPPANPVIAPPAFVMPPEVPPPPPAIPFHAEAPGEVKTIAKGICLIFAPDSADVNQKMLSALQAVAAKLKADAALTVAIDAYAPGTAQDPSTPRRLSLSRALAARAVLIHAGIASDRIYARAQGFIGIGIGPAERADITILQPGH
jgi:outer membrane protein OmpA-like peptidoglycan-associated protein